MRDAVGSPGMRVGVVAQHASAGGGTRFLRPLLRALADEYEDMHFNVLINADAAKDFGAAEGLDHDRMDIIPVDPMAVAGVPPEPNLTTLKSRIGHHVNPILRRDYESKKRVVMRRLMRGLRGCDVVYLSWPYFLDPMKTDLPVVGTFHDFNYKHDFGVFNPIVLPVLERQVRFWLSRCEVPVVSSAFIGDEVERFYGDVAREPHVVRLSSMVTHRPDAETIAAAVTKYGLDERYVICASNASNHKNLYTLLRAYKAVRASGGPQLVFIGGFTHLLAGGFTPEILRDPAAVRLKEALEESGLVHGRDVMGLGFVSDADADALIAGAELLVAPSLYEAGCGPGVDAWALGTPVVMSDIPPFAEHLSFLGVDAELFDPRDPADMARCILEVVDDDHRKAEMSRVSAEAMARYTWTDVARGYRDAFDRAIAARSAGAPQGRRKVQ